MGRIFKPKRTGLAHHINIGGGALYADFYVDEKNPKESCLHIYSPNNKFGHRVQGFTFGYLLTAVRQGNEAEVEAYCAMIWKMSQEIYQDIDFCKDIVNAIMACDERLLNKGAERAAAVTEAQNEADEALMTEVAREADRVRPE